MPKIIKIIGSGIVFLFGWGWWFLDLAGRGFALRELSEMFPRLVDFLSKHQEIGYQMAPWGLMVAGFLFLIFLEWPHLLRVRRKGVTTEPSRSTAPTQQAAYFPTNTAHSSTAALPAPQFRNYAELLFNAAEQAVIVSTNVGTFTRNGPGDYTFNFDVPLSPGQFKYYASPPLESVSVTGSSARITFDETKNSTIFVGFGEKGKPQ
jgi:hypothetical protein